MGTVRLAEAVRAYAGGPRPRILFTSSAEVYGRRDAGEFPLRETLDLRPATPYGASKAAAEMVLLALRARPSISTSSWREPFNHIGPGQNRALRGCLAVLAQLARGRERRSLRICCVGNLGAARDFLDVRDVVAA